MQHTSEEAVHIARQLPGAYDSFQGGSLWVKLFTRCAFLQLCWYVTDGLILVNGNQSVYANWPQDTATSSQCESH